MHRKAFLILKGQPLLHKPYVGHNEIWTWLIQIEGFDVFRTVPIPSKTLNYFSETLMVFYEDLWICLDRNYS